METKEILCEVCGNWHEWPECKAKQASRLWAHLFAYTSVAILGITGAGMAGERPWHLMTTTLDGHVSLSSSAEGRVLDLTRSQCEFMWARALGLPATPEEQKAADERYKRTHPICPPEKSSKEEWKTWQDTHPLAVGCDDADGHGSQAWGMTYSSMGNIANAECFQ
jgi:hypothetical protein